MALLFRTRALLLIAVALFATAGCQYLPADANAPAGVVGAAFAAIEEGGLARLPEFTCAAQKNNPYALLGQDLNTLQQMINSGIDPTEVANGMQLKFENLKVTEVSKSDQAATVNVKGTVTKTLDRAVFRKIVTQMFKDQGVIPTEQMLDATEAQFASQMTSTQSFNTNYQLVLEDGKWVLCP
jgi:hypothetical protein